MFLNDNPAGKDHCTPILPAIQGLGADPEEKREPVSNIDITVVNSCQERNGHKVLLENASLVRCAPMSISLSCSRPPRQEIIKDRENAYSLHYKRLSDDFYIIQA
jgi:hypothetical protein